jgi:hypothetical protein
VAGIPRAIGELWRIALLGVMVVIAVGNHSARASHDPDGVYCAAPAEMEMLALINDFRAGSGLEPLGLSAPLGAAATHKSEEMAREEYLAHTSPDGVTPREFVTAHGYAHNTAIGENLAAGRESAQATFSQWRDSPSHRELMLDADFAAVGIARADNVATPYDWYWTAEFGGVLADPAEPCDGGTEPRAAAPAATPQPAGDAMPIRVVCEGTRFADGTYDVSCRDA